MKSMITRTVTYGAATLLLLVVASCDAGAFQDPTAAAGGAPGNPSIPANVSASGVSSSQIDVSWSASSDNVGVSGYYVYRDGSQVADVTSTGYSDTGLAASTTYGYEVAAYDAAGNVSARSTGVSATTQAPPGGDGFDAYAELPRAEVDFTMPTTTQTITVKASGGDYSTLQAAWNSLSTRTANTEIVIDAGYDPGPLSTGPQSGDDSYWVIVRSANSGSLPRHVRVGPADKADMPQLVVPAGVPALDIGDNTKRVRFVGISTETGPSSYPTYNVRTSYTSQYIIFDRCLADGGYSRGMDSRFGYRIDGEHMGVIDSYIYDVNTPRYESKAILVISGAGPYTFVNNFLEAGSINILFGGADPGSDALIPRDITFARNYSYRRPEWAADSDVAVKNSFEIKHGIRFLIEDNAFENFWDVAQGHMIKIKSVDGYGATGYARDVTFRYNTLENFDGGIALGAQPTNTQTGLSAPYPLQNVSIHNNEATNGGFDNPYYDGPTEQAVSFNGGIDYMDISHNDFRGSFSNQVVNDGSVNNGLIFEYNIVDEASYGFSDASSLDAIAPSGSVTGNILAPATWNTSLPAGNCITWPPPDAACPNAGVQTSRHASTKSGDFSSDPWSS